MEDFIMAASQNDVWLDQQMCHIMAFFHDCFMIKDEIMKVIQNIKVFVIF
jgi:hypothetical protein